MRYEQMIEDMERSIESTEAAIAVLQREIDNRRAYIASTRENIARARGLMSMAHAGTGQLTERG